MTGDLRGRGVGRDGQRLVNIHVGQLFLCMRVSMQVVVPGAISHL